MFINKILRWNVLFLDEPSILEDAVRDMFIAIRFVIPFPDVLYYVYRERRSECLRSVNYLTESSIGSFSDQISSEKKKKVLSGKLGRLLKFHVIK